MFIYCCGFVVELNLNHASSWIHFRKKHFLHISLPSFSSRRQHVHFACDLTRMTSAYSRHRACCHIWTFTTPRDYLQNAAERKDQCQYVPEDFSRNDICEMFRTAMLEIGQSSILEQLVVVKEPLLNHYGFQFRVIFKTKTCFASDDINTLLAQKRGCRGSMSRPEKNWQSLVQYVLDCKTKRKEVAEDKIPLFWPHMWQTKSQVLQQWQDQAMSRKQCTSKRENPNLEQLQLKRRRTMKFADFVEIAKQNGIPMKTIFGKLLAEKNRQVTMPCGTMEAKSSSARKSPRCYK